MNSICNVQNWINYFFGKNLVYLVYSIPNKVIRIYYYNLLSEQLYKFCFSDFATMIQCTKQLKHVVEDLKTEIRDLRTETNNLKIAIKDLKSKIRHLTSKNMSSDNGKEEISEITSIQIKGTNEVSIPVWQYANQKDVQTSLCVV